MFSWHDGTHDGAIPKQNQGVWWQKWVTGADGVRTLDVGSSLEGMEWEEAVTGDRRSRGASGLLRAGVIWLISRRNVMIAVGGRDDASDSRIYGILASVCSFARPRAHPRLHEETYQTQF